MEEYRWVWGGGRMPLSPGVRNAALTALLRLSALRFGAVRCSQQYVYYAGAMYGACR